jgi:hypothetical protein
MLFTAYSKWLMHYLGLVIEPVFYLAPGTAPMDAVWTINFILWIYRVVVIALISHINSHFS